MTLPINERCSALNHLTIKMDAMYQYSLNIYKVNWVIWICRKWFKIIFHEEIENEGKPYKIEIKHWSKRNIAMHFIKHCLCQGQISDLLLLYIIMIVQLSRKFESVCSYLPVQYTQSLLSYTDLMMLHRRIMQIWEQTSIYQNLPQLNQKWDENCRIYHIIEEQWK